MPWSQRQHTHVHTHFLPTPIPPPLRPLPLHPATSCPRAAENEDAEEARFGRDYRNLSLLITTGPGPVPSLDGENIVVGHVAASSMDVVAAIAQVPTFTPDDNGRQFNALASFIGDERAAKTRAKWGRPLQPVVIVASGVLK